MDMLKELLEKAKRNQDKKTEEQPKTKEVQRPLARVFGFLQNRQEVRLGVLYSLCSQNQTLEEPKPQPALKTEVSYIG